MSRINVVLLQFFFSPIHSFIYVTFCSVDRLLVAGVTIDVILVLLRQLRTKFFIYYILIFLNLSFDYPILPVYYLSRLSYLLQHIPL